MKSSLRSRCLSIALALAATAASATTLELAPENALAPRINNGVLTHESPSVALFFTGEGTCTATLIGCRTALTAAHCVCDQPPCNPAPNGFLFFQSSGFYPVTDIDVHPGWDPDSGLARHDLAVLKLAAPAAGIAPSALNALGKPGPGVTVGLVGFGSAGTAPEGIKRAGLATLTPCLDGNANGLCYDFVPPLGAPGEDSTACPGDSGGPMFGSSNGNLLLVGATSGGYGDGAADCSEPLQGAYSDVYMDRAWIEAKAAGDLGQGKCGGLPNAGSPKAPYAGGSGTLNANKTSVDFTVQVPAGTANLFTTLNAESYYANDFDLYVRRGAPPTVNTYDCKSEGEAALEACGVANPEPGTWHLMAKRMSGSGVFQITATAYAGDDPGNGDPAPPSTGAITSSQYPDFRFWVRISDSRIGTAVGGCLPETVCVAGAIPSRAEVFLRIVGPKANGRLWPNIVKFNTTRTEVWIRQISTGHTKYYELPALPTDGSELPGLVDKEGFLP